MILVSKTHMRLLIVTLVISCTVSEIRRLIGRKLRIFRTPLLFGAPLPVFPSNVRGEVERQETRVMGLLYSRAKM